MSQRCVSPNAKIPENITVIGPPVNGFPPSSTSSFSHCLPLLDPPSSVLLPDQLPPARSSTSRPHPYTGTLRPSLTTTTTTTVPPPRRRDDDNFLPEARTWAPPSAQTPVVIDYCAPRQTGEISWPQTHQGQVAKKPCPPNSIGKMYRGTELP